MACRKQRHQGESREHVHRRIIAYLLARVHLAPCIHIKHSHINTAVSVCVWVRTITLLSRPTHSAHPMGVISIEIARISMHRSNILDLVNSGENLKVPSKFSYRIHLIKYTHARDFWDKCRGHLKFRGD